jgi:hypothetical protein
MAYFNSTAFDPGYPEWVRQVVAQESKPGVPGIPGTLGGRDYSAPAFNYYTAATAPQNVTTPITAATPGNLGSTVAGNWTPQFGGKPAVPSPVATAGAATAGNLANYPAINELTGNINTTNREAVLANVGANIPNYTGLIGQRSGNIQANLAGEVPKDVQNLLQTQAAERGIAAGIPGSQAIDYSNLASLGLTSLQRQDTGAQQLGSALSTVPNTPIADPSSMMVSPSDVQSAQYASNVIGAAADPTAAANEAFNRLLQMRALAEQGAQRGGSQPRQNMPQTPQSGGGGASGPTWAGGGWNYGQPSLDSTGYPYLTGTAAQVTTPNYQSGGIKGYDTDYTGSLDDIFGGGSNWDSSYYDPSSQVYSPEYYGGWYDWTDPSY